MNYKSSQMRLGRTSEGDRALGLEDGVEDVFQWVDGPGRVYPRLREVLHPRCKGLQHLGASL